MHAGTQHAYQCCVGIGSQPIVPIGYRYEPITSYWQYWQY